MYIHCDKYTLNHSKRTHSGPHLSLLQDFRPDWLNGLTVFVGDSTDWTLGHACLSVPFNQSASFPYISDFDCPNTGRYVTVRTGRFDSRLQLCEVQVCSVHL